MLLHEIVDGEAVRADLPHLITSLPGPRAKAIIERDAAVLSPSYTRSYPLVAERGQGAIVIDPDCEFVQEFYSEARGDVVLNPLDARCPFWSPWLEFRDETFAMDAEALAASLVRGQPRNSSEQFFQESSRTLLESIFTVLKGDQS